MKTASRLRELLVVSALALVIVMAPSSVLSGKGSSVNPWGRNFLPLIHLSTENDRLKRMPANSFLMVCSDQ